MIVALSMICGLIGDCDVSLVVPFGNRLPFNLQVHPAI